MTLEDAAAEQLDLLDEIRARSEATDCWIVMDEGMVSRPVPLEEWRRMYDASGWPEHGPGR